jgi:transposase-like protein
VLKLRQVEVLQGQGKSVQEAVRQIDVTVQTYYRWRMEYGGMSRDQLKRLKELETENTRLGRASPKFKHSSAEPDIDLQPPRQLGVAGHL